MLNIKNAIAEIYSDSPSRLYFFTGPEYGVKVEYLDVLKARYSNRVEERSTLDEVFQLFKQRSLVPVPETLYVVRYDKSFISSLSDIVVSRINRLKIHGTVVALYLDDKDEAKLDKYFPNSVVRINAIPEAVQLKHLKNKFPDLPELYVKESIRLSEDYFKACTICRLMCCLSRSQLSRLSRKEIESIFGYFYTADSDAFKLAIASKDFASAIREIEAYTGDLSNLFYDILSSMLEIIKVIEKPYSESQLKPYSKLWTKQSASKYYEIVYDQLSEIRSNSMYDPYNSLVYVCSLLKYKLS